MVTWDIFINLTLSAEAPVETLFYVSQILKSYQAASKVNTHTKLNYTQTMLNVISSGIRKYTPTKVGTNILISENNDILKWKK